MARSAAAKATEAADAVLDWLRTQPRAAVPEILPIAHAAERSGQNADDTPDADLPPATAGAPDPMAAGPRAARALGKGPTENGVPLRLAHTDWLHHRLTISGPEDGVAAFRTAAAGAGIIPWQLDLDRMEEDFFHLLVAPPTLPGSLTPQRRTLSLAGARIVAGQLREAVAHHHQLAVARVGSSRACPFDLHALAPVPDDILQRGPDDPESGAWLWQRWGTTEALRHVTEDAAVSEQERRRQEPAQAAFCMQFWSTDWTPWRALARLAEDWPALRFDMRPTSDAP